MPSPRLYRLLADDHELVAGAGVTGTGTGMGSYSDLGSPRVKLPPRLLALPMLASVSGGELIKDAIRTRTLIQIVRRAQSPKSSVGFRSGHQRIAEAQVLLRLQWAPL
jgi:hypothetical protein